MELIPSALYGLLILAFSLAACSLSEQSAAVPVFDHRIVDAAPNAGNPCCLDVLATGDLDGDGRSDIVVGGENAGDHGLVWYQSPTWIGHPIASGQFTTDGQTADVNGDGRVDVVISDLGAGIRWFENTGEAAVWRSNLISADYAHDLELGDIDRNGRVDVVIRDKRILVILFHLGPDRWLRRVLVTLEGEGLDLADLDADGDLDVVAGATWYETPADARAGSYTAHRVAPSWVPVTRVRAADMNEDNRLDLVLTVSEASGPIAWFEAPADPRTASWKRHAVDTRLDGAHSLQVADFDNDGDLDILTAEMHTSAKRRIIVYVNEGLSWRRNVIGSHGSHNMRVADLDGDGDIDIVGKNYEGADKPVEMWINRTRDRPTMLSLDRWHYAAIDARRPQSEFGKMGLLCFDVNADRFTDVLAGGFLYLNAGGNAARNWTRVAMPDDVDVLFALRLDSAPVDVIGISPRNELLWLHPTRSDLSAWQSIAVGSVPDGRTQGYAVAQLRDSGFPQLVFTRGRNLFLLDVPDDPALRGRSWPLTHVSSQVEEEGVAVGDIDGDGDADLAAFDHADGRHVAVWFENNQSGGRAWVRHVIGDGERWLDRIALGDLDGDGRLDVVATEETQDLDYNANVYWFSTPRDVRSGGWTRRTIDTLRSVNSLDVRDMDNDGHLDIIVGEHTDFTDSEPADDNATLVYRNVGTGMNWERHVVERAPHSSHLGTRTCDLDGDGDFDIVSTGWDQRRIHSWRNDAPLPLARIAGHASSPAPRYVTR